MLFAGVRGVSNTYPFPSNIVFYKNSVSNLDQYRTLKRTAELREKHSDYSF